MSKKSSIKVLLENTDLSQFQIAHRCEISQAYVCRINSKVKSNESTDVALVPKWRKGVYAGWGTMSNC